MYKQPFLKGAILVNNRFDHNKILNNTKSQDYYNETKVLMNMESVHQRKKAAFDELLRYTCNNLKDSNNDNPSNKQL